MPWRWFEWWQNNRGCYVSEIGASVCTMVLAVASIQTQKVSNGKGEKKLQSWFINTWVIFQQGSLNLLEEAEFIEFKMRLFWDNKLLRVDGFKYAWKTSKNCCDFIFMHQKIEKAFTGKFSMHNKSTSHSLWKSKLSFCLLQSFFICC